jgi:hypothetical protein
MDDQGIIDAARIDYENHIFNRRFSQLKEQNRRRKFKEFIIENPNISLQ